MSVSGSQARPQIAAPWCSNRAGIPGSWIWGRTFPGSAHIPKLADVCLTPPRNHPPAGRNARAELQGEQSTASTSVPMDMGVYIARDIWMDGWMDIYSQGNMDIWIYIATSTCTGWRGQVAQLLLAASPQMPQLQTKHGLATRPTNSS